MFYACAETCACDRTAHMPKPDLYNDNFIVQTCEISKNNLMCIRTEILTVKELSRNVLSKKMCFHFHYYPFIYIYVCVCVCIYIYYCRISQGFCPA